MVGLPEGSRGPGSFDAGSEGGWGATIEDRRDAGSTASPSRYQLLHRLLDHEPVLHLEIRGTRPTAIEMTAALHTWLLLAEDSADRPVFLGRLEEGVSGGLAALETAIRAGWDEVQRELVACDDEVAGHPGMGWKRLDEIDRRRTELRARWIFEPLSSECVRDLLGLPSLNAGEKRNSNYRAARAALFPLVGSLLSSDVAEPENVEE